MWIVSIIEITCTILNISSSNKMLALKWLFFEDKRLSTSFFNKEIVLKWLFWKDSRLNSFFFNETIALE